MVLSDREIESRIRDHQIIENYDPDCLTNFGYDLRAKYFAVGKEQKSKATLKPGESVFVAAEESVKVPLDAICRIALRNSRIRQGFLLDAPVYQPGHHTRVFFRLTNISGNELLLDMGEKYATIMFEQLSSEPLSPYNGAFKAELDFSGLSGYADAYEKQIREIEKKTADLESLERTIYGNVLVILTVFVALFSFLTVNVSLLSTGSTLESFFIGNFVMLGCISFLVVLIKNATLKEEKKVRLTQWIPAILCFSIAFILLYIVLSKGVAINAQI